MKSAVLIACLAVTLQARADTWSGGGIVSEKERRADVAIKEARLAAFMAAQHLDAMVLTRWRNHAWILGGSDTRIVASQAESPVWLLFTSDGSKYLISNNIEAARLLSEEGLAGLGYLERRFPWFTGLAGGTDERWRTVQEIAGAGQIGADGPLPGGKDVGGALARSRFPLTQVESRRYRWLGPRCAAAVAETCRELAPGMRETEIAGRLAAKLVSQSITPTVVLIGTDDRLAAHRHLTPTEAKLKRYALVNLCAERWGLVIAVSRLVHFGPLSADLGKRMQACVAVDAAFQAAARPGAALQDVMAAASAAYAREGYPEEWRVHHQGGPIGYFEREFLIGPESPELVLEGMALAFNPTLPGVKVEDTFLVGPRGQEILTQVAGWPVRKAVVNGVTYERPDILVRPLP